VDVNTSPRCGLVMTPGENWGAKLLYSEAFRRAFAAEGYLNSSFLIGNPELAPETIETSEAQINYQNRLCQIDLTYFHSSQKVIEVDSSERPLRFINHPGEMTTDGLEFTGRAAMGKSWHILGSGITQSTDNDVADPLIAPNYPDYMLKGGVMGNFKKINVGLFNSYFSDGSWRHERFNNLQANLSFDVSRLMHMPVNHARFSVYADNIMDEKPFSHPSNVGVNEPLPQYYGRRIYATMALKF